MKRLWISDIARISDIVLLDAVKSLDDNCSIYLKHKKPILKPVVGFSLSQDFNETVAMDFRVEKC